VSQSVTGLNTHSETDMSANPQFMEHRWGTRVELVAPAKLMTGEGLCDGVLRNASLSGAYIETSARPALLSRVSLRPDSAGGQWLDGWVVRIENAGVAVEWLDPPLHAVAILLSLHGGESGHHQPGMGRDQRQQVIPMRPRQPPRMATAK